LIHERGNIHAIDINPVNGQPGKWEKTQAGNARRPNMVFAVLALLPESKGTGKSPKRFSRLARFSENTMCWELNNGEIGIPMSADNLVSGFRRLTHLSGSCTIGG
jgi:hypothetical protein